MDHTTQYPDLQNVAKHPSSRSRDWRKEKYFVFSHDVRFSGSILISPSVILPREICMGNASPRSEFVLFSFQNPMARPTAGSFWWRRACLKPLLLLQGKNRARKINAFSSGDRSAVVSVHGVVWQQFGLSIRSGDSYTCSRLYSTLNWGNDNAGSPVKRYCLHVYGKTRGPFGPIPFFSFYLDRVFPLTCHFGEPLRTFSDIILSSTTDVRSRCVCPASDDNCRINGHFSRRKSAAVLQYDKRLWAVFWLPTILLSESSSPYF